MTKIIFDLEATCWEGKPKNFRQEIIEIGAYKIDEFGEVIDKFQQFIKPQVHPYLSSYCVKLTSITQKDVERAKIFPIVIENFISWIDEEHYSLLSWGTDDKELLYNDCILHKIETGWLKRKHVDLKEEYRRIKNRPEKISFSKALDIENITYIGTQHRAIYDAANLVNLYTKYIDMWS